MRSISQFLTLSVVAVATNALKFAVLSDMHLQPYYDPNIDAQHFCQNYFIKNKLKLSYQDLITSSDYAPLGRLLCDPPADLIESFMRRINETEGQVDVILLTGDMIGHNLAVNPGVTDKPELYQKLLEVHSQLGQLLNKYFPNSLVLPTLGNNDCRYHYQSPYENDKQEYYSYLFETYFLNHTRNNQIKELSEIQNTFLDGGYYRVDLSEKISMLMINTLMYNKNNDPANQGDQLEDQFAWLEKQFMTAEHDRKFIISNHIYPGSKQEQIPAKLWHSNYTSDFIEILLKYNDKILLEVSGHDHISDLRYNHGSKIHQSAKKSLTSGSLNDFNFHNIVIAPGVTSASAQNPGYALFTVEDQDHISARNLTMVFLPIQKTYNWTSIPQDLSQWPFRTLNFNSFGLHDLSADSFHELRHRLQKDNKLLLNYLALKTGFDPNDPIEFQTAIAIHQKVATLLTSDLNPYVYFCQMHKNLGHLDYTNCIDDNKPKSKTFQFEPKFKPLQI
ncbi:UNKNOWN [Stylonychia lemnae]|uniref:Calcineurin-like phosphoesterase domain-containing protein n=1 Tax=Stylonychia lemnae TaxID=5949 RepID=A0A078ALG5_STYLE|nr:UNKNOWN [Stylonychia lemnae]|eukprot:CDW83200.1 UNKNOWN [Stylonychia lemnae]